MTSRMTVDGFYWNENRKKGRIKAMKMILASLAALLAGCMCTTINDEYSVAEPGKDCSLRYEKVDDLNSMLTYSADVIPVVIDDNVVDLAEKIVANGILKKKIIDDCQHIAAAILSDCDIIISWNFKHIVNVKTIRGIKMITTIEGYKDLLIYQPTVLLNAED